MFGPIFSEPIFAIECLCLGDHTTEIIPHPCEPLCGMLPQPFGLILLGTLPTPQVQSDYSIESALVGYLTSAPRLACLVGNRVYPGAVDRKNVTAPTIVYTLDREHQQVLGGSAGYAWADVYLDVWSPLYSDVVKTVEAIRLSMQGFRGWFGAVQIGAVTISADSDSIERNSDGSGAWFYSKSLDYRLAFAEPVPHF